MSRKLLGVMAIAGAALSATPAMASDPTSLLVGPTRIEFLGDETTERTVTITVGGDQAGTVSLEMVDAAIGDTGSWRAVPYGSTENSLQGVLRIVPHEFAYVPGGGPQSVEAVLSIDPSLVRAPLFGSLQVALDPPKVSSSGISVVTRGAVEIQVLAAPSGDVLEDLPSSQPRLAIFNLSIGQMEPWTPVDGVFPDLPWIVNHGPISVAASGTNAGNLVLDSRVAYDFTRLSPLEVFSGTPAPAVFTVENRPRYLLPGASFTDTSTSLIPVEGVPTVDSLPFIGFVRVTATATGNISGLEAPPVSKAVTFLVFPWKESLFVFLVWLFQREWRHRKGRKVNAADAPPPPTLRTRLRERLRRVAPLRRPSED